MSDKHYQLSLADALRLPATELLSLYHHLTPYAFQALIKAATQQPRFNPLLR